MSALIETAVRNGHSQKRAAMLCGVSEQSIITWKQRGEREKSGLYFEFLERLKACEAEFIESNLCKIREAAHKSRTVTKKRITRHADGSQTQEVITTENAPVWQASAWLLERTRPEIFGRTSVKVDTEATVTHKTDGGTPPKLVVEFVEPSSTEKTADGE